MGNRPEDCDERRASSRVSLSTDVVVSSAREQPLPCAVTVDISLDGVLLAFPEPVSFEPGARIVVSLALTDGRLHSLAVVQRTDRGADYRTYVAVTFEHLGGEDRRRLAEALGV